MPIATDQAAFYREFLMARNTFDPKEFGVDLSKEDFGDEMVSDFGAIYRGQWTFDELLLHPREAQHFCDEVRRMHGYFDLPDDIILRTILTRRKNPGR
jgi:hypothetical protein